MFTGLIEGMGAVERVTPRGPDAVLAISPPWPADELVMGESIAVNGACLTVTEISGRGFSVDVSAESLDRTTLGRLRVGSRVNLERALRFGDRLGGHLVTGHVDCVGRLEALRPLGASTVLELSLPAEHLALVVEKGSVAIDGISLTVNQVTAAGFRVNIIPHTLAATTLSLVKVGDSVNIETDLIGKYIARLINRDEAPSGPQGREPAAGGLSADGLKKMGY